MNVLYWWVNKDNLLPRKLCSIMLSFEAVIRSYLTGEPTSDTPNRHPVSDLEGQEPLVPVRGPRHTHSFGHSLFTAVMLGARGVKGSEEVHMVCHP